MSKTGFYTSKKTGSKWQYKSSWEHELMVRLDESDNVKSWTYETFFIVYHDGLKIRKYYPDFLVIDAKGNNYLVEVKPDRLKESKLNRDKSIRAAVYCEEHKWSYVSWDINSAREPWNVK